ncbi:MAG: HEPN domain-containing protein [archaeon]|nr:HEPN domain-containing protein [archaeon]
MRTDELALDYLTRAERVLEEARNTLRNEDYSLTIRRSQEAVELSLKAALRFLAIEYPRAHDVSDVLRFVKEARPLPNWFKENIEFMARVSSDLARKRGPSFYGDERTLTPPSRLFAKEEGLRALTDAEEVFEICKKLIK